MILRLSTRHIGRAQLPIPALETAVRRCSECHVFRVEIGAHSDEAPPATGEHRRPRTLPRQRAISLGVLRGSYGQGLPERVRHSRDEGSARKPFLGIFLESVSGDTYHDTVYITSNPYIIALLENTFHAVKLDESWNRTTEQAPPDQITNVPDESASSHLYGRLR